MWNCSECGTENQGNFCSECGKERTDRTQDTIRVKKIDSTDKFDGGVTVKYKVEPKDDEKEKTKEKINKPAIAGICIGVVFVLILSGIFAFYMSAKIDLKNADYVSAAEKFEKLSFFADSKKLAEKCVYENALMLMEEGAFAEAKAEFERVEALEDAQEMIFECEYSMLLKFKSDGDFESAAELIGAMEEKRRKINEGKIGEIELWCNYAYAESIIDTEPLEARKLLEAIDDGYENTKQLILECTYRLAKKYEAEGKFDEAYMEFEKCIDYKDSAYLASALQSNVLSSAVAAFGDGEYEKCKSLLEMCENLTEEENEKADAYKLFLSYKTDAYQRPAVNNRLFSYLGSYTDARKTVLEDADVFADFFRGSWRSGDDMMFEISDSFYMTGHVGATDGECRYKDGVLYIYSNGEEKKIFHDMEIINQDRIKVYFTNDSSEHILMRL